jgi:hypothetical protein
MSFEETGFIGTNIQPWIKKIHDDHATLFSIADETNKLCQGSLHDINAHNKDPQEVVVACLYIRILSNYQSIYLHCERGMNPEARMILRCMYEAIFILGAVVKDSKLVLTYIKEHEKRRHEFIQKLKRLQDKPDNYDSEKILALETTLQEEIKQIEKFKTEDWAKKAGLHDIYLGPYTILSGTVHVKISDLEQYTIVDEKGDIRDFKYGPDDTDIDSIFGSAIEFMLLAGRITLTFFKIDKSKQFDDLLSKLHQLISTTGNIPVHNEASKDGA